MVVKILLSFVCIAGFILGLYVIFPFTKMESALHLPLLYKILVGLALGFANYLILVIFGLNKEGDNSEADSKIYGKWIIVLISVAVWFIFGSIKIVHFIPYPLITLLGILVMSSFNTDEIKNRLKLENPEEYLNIVRKENEEIRKAKQKSGKLLTQFYNKWMPEQPETIEEYKEPQQVKIYKVRTLILMSSALLILAGTIIIFSKITTEDMRHITTAVITVIENIVIAIVNIGIIVLIIAVIRFFIRLYHRCPHCGKLGALVLGGTEVLDRYKATEKRTGYRRNKKGEITSSYDKFVTVTRETYKDIYQCKYCEEITEKIKTRTLD